MLGRVAMATACVNGRRVGAISYADADGLVSSGKELAAGSMGAN